MTATVKIFKQPTGPDTHRLIISTLSSEIICTGSAYNLFNIICYEDDGLEDEFYEPLINLTDKQAILDWLMTIAVDFAEVGPTEFEDIKPGINIHILSEINDSSVDKFTINKISVVLWSSFVFYFMYDVVTTFPDINYVSVGALASLLILRNYLLRN